MMQMKIDPDTLIAEAHKAAANAYAPYSGFHVGAALLFDDGSIIGGANFENASYGLSICAETAALLEANNHGLRKGLVAAAIVGGQPEANGEQVAANGGQIVANAVPVTPCGRCRQMLNEVAQLGDTDPIIYCGHATGYTQHRLSHLLPEAFGPANLD